ncbi:unnamed protein product [Cuscuta epithymum]|uniref:Uncharacterized protein n=1 Tax=Cuscuta epithymum TaxID=186058 RepID=A0AAV0FLI5_9ASTE|nr:unnamed protein product [Cuscuta epithymum]
MGRAAGGDEQTALLHRHSSIALLQERFRQLERAKEIRQERELSRSGPPSSYHHHHHHSRHVDDRTTYYERSQTEFLFPPPPPAKPSSSSSSKLPLSLWPADSSPTAEEMRRINDVNLTPPWVMAKYDHLYHTYSPDVDTSLHL